MFLSESEISVQPCKVDTTAAERHSWLDVYVTLGCFGRERRHAFLRHPIFLGSPQLFCVGVSLSLSLCLLLSTGMLPLFQPLCVGGLLSLTYRTQPATKGNLLPVDVLRSAQPSALVSYPGPCSRQAACCGHGTPAISRCCAAASRRPVSVVCVPLLADSVVLCLVVGVCWE